MCETNAVYAPLSGEGKSESLPPNPGEPLPRHAWAELCQPLWGEEEKTGLYLLGEQVTWRHCIGGALIVTGSIVLALP